MLREACSPSRFGTCAVSDSCSHEIESARSRSTSRSTATNLWFASEAKAILQDPPFAREVRRLRAIDAFLHYQHVPDVRAPLPGSRGFPPRTRSSSTRRELEQTRYWKLSYGEAASASPMRSRASSFESSCSRLRACVFVAMFRVGAFLSGGVDSSAVVAAAAQQTAGRLKTFTIGFEDERIRRTAKRP